MPRNHAVFRAFGTSFRPRCPSERPRKEPRPTGAKADGSAVGKDFSEPPGPHPSNPPRVIRSRSSCRPPPRALVSATAPALFFPAFLFLGLTFLFRSISSPPPLLLSVSICAIGRAILVSSLAGGSLASVRLAICELLMPLLLITPLPKRLSLLLS